MRTGMDCFFQFHGIDCISSWEGKAKREREIQAGSEGTVSFLGTEEIKLNLGMIGGLGLSRGIESCLRLVRGSLKPLSCLRLSGRVDRQVLLYGTTINYYSRYY